MSSLEWRREQPRVEPPSHHMMWWIDLIVCVCTALVGLIYLVQFAVYGEPLLMVAILAVGYVFARYYPFG